MATMSETVGPTRGDGGARLQAAPNSSGGIAQAALPRRVTIVVEDHGTATASTEERVLVALERAQGFGQLKGLKRRLPVGCRRGGCGVCRVRVLSGAYRAGPMSRDHVSPAEEADGVVLACAIWALDDLTLRIEPAPVKKGTGRTAD